MTYLPPDPPIDAVEPAAKVRPESVLAAPRNPVTRWNRRYLVAGAAVLAAIVAVGFWIGFGAGHKAPAKAPPPPASDATTTAPDIGDRYAKGYGDPAVQALNAPGQAALPATGPGAVAPGAQAAAPPARPVDPAVQRAQQEASAARTASPFFAASGGPPPVAAATPGFLPVAAAGPAAAAPEAAVADVQPANGQGGKRQFVATAKADDYLANPLRAPESPWEVKAGTVIPAALLTAINSDLPGEIIAQVTEPVYDHVTGRTVLIPQGSRLIGKYDSQVAYGQERALIAWNRIVMPDGRSINIGSMEGADLTGASGLKDQVDGHFWQLARGILLSTVFSVGAASAQDASARSSGGLVLNSAGNGVANEAEQVGSQITSRDLNRQPTIKVRAGWPLRVLVNKDMILAPYP
jgi:type IV secretion system protein VirB10